VPTLVAAPAKLTLSLHITGVRADGYHLLDAEVVSLDLADELCFTAGDGLELLDEVGRGLPVPADDDNLVRRALDLIGRRAHVTLRKRIPAGAGLGGGSSDAAAVLRWAGVDDLALAARLGADVPACLLGGRARVSGVGEIVHPLEPIAATYTLLVPPFGCATPAVYRAWDELGGPAHPTNDLEAAALHVEPRLAAGRDRLAQATGRTPRLAGSGSTWFVEGEFPGPGLLVARSSPVPLPRPGGTGRGA
jgi:4-diphosphocytidyl-2-C-methyl-D-erythritol kinase